MILLHNALPMEMPSGQARKPRPVEVDPRILQHLKLNEPWTSESNQLVAATKVKQFLCPPSIPEIPANTPAPTQYIGIGGLGIDTPRKTLFDSAKVAGVFRYDGPTPLNTFADGLSNTVAFSETNFQIGPWMAGGESTVRGIDPTVDQYFGVGRPLGGFHPGGTNIGMADGSVRFITEKIQVGIFRAMCTIAGGEKEFGGD
jgi:prepilin-type processing-associated H-X9-DG protein